MKNLTPNDDRLFLTHRERIPGRSMNASPSPASSSSSLLAEKTVIPPLGGSGDRSENGPPLDEDDGSPSGGEEESRQKGPCGAGHGEPPRKKQRLLRRKKTKPSPTRSTTTAAEAAAAPANGLIACAGPSPSSILITRQRQEDRYRRNISWDDDKNQTFKHEHPRASFQDYNETDVWYTRSEYDKFLMDRIRTVECLQGSGSTANDGTLSHHGLTASSMPSASTSSSASSFLLSDVYCMRGLEPFRDTMTNRDMNCKRKLHKSTVMMEQVRQALLGVNDPERFRLLVSPQSELALHRARELAALDEYEADRCDATTSDRSGSTHGRRRPPPRRSSMSSVPTSANAMADPLAMGSSSAHGNSRNDDIPKYYSNSIAGNVFPMTFSGALPSSASMTPAPGSSLFSERIRRLQESNARRLMEIYNPSGAGGGGGTGDSSNSNHHLFRFSLRRDSLSGGTMGGSSGMASMDTAATGSSAPSRDAGVSMTRNEMEQQLAMMASRFPLRRDSLSHLGASER